MLKKNYVHSFFKNGSQSSFNQFNNKLISLNMNKVVLKIRNNFLEIQFLIWRSNSKHEYNM